MPACVSLSHAGLVLGSWVLLRLFCLVRVTHLCVHAVGCGDEQKAQGVYTLLQITKSWPLLRKVSGSIPRAPLGFEHNCT